MSDKIVFKIVGQNNTKRECTVLTENKKFINSIITVGKDNTITEADLKTIQDVAKRAGDAGVLEQADLNGEQKINLAKINGFAEYYDITLSKDGKYLQVKIKDAGIFTANPTLGIIKEDFGVRNNVFVNKGEILHGNAGVIPSSANGNYDNVQISAGKTINIPVEEVTVNSSPCNGFARFLSMMCG